MNGEPPVSVRPRWWVSEETVQVGLAVVLLGLGIAVGVMWFRARSAPAGRRRPPLLPEAHPIWDCWRAAEAGDVEKYLACFTGPAREQREGERERLGRGAFQRRIQEESDSVQSVEVGPPKPAGESALVFPVRTRRGEEEELSDYTVVQVAKEWRIREVASRGRAPVRREAEPPAKQGDPK